MHKGGKGMRQSRDKEHDRSGVGKVRYVALSAGCECSGINGMRPLRSVINLLYNIVRLVGVWIKRKEVMDEARMIRIKKLREHQYREDMLGLLRGRE